MEQTYNEFIQEILDTRGRFGITEGYKERHHIIPRCIGGSNNKDNLIDLYAKEHFIAHMLLAKENPTNEHLVYAWHMMCTCSKGDNERYEVTPDEYEEAKIHWIQFHRINSSTSSTGRKWFTDGVNEVFSFECPNGWHEGRKESLKEITGKYKSGNKYNVGKHWYNNGIVNVCEFECPDGFVEGTLPMTDEAKHAHSISLKNNPKLKKRKNNRGFETLYSVLQRIDENEFKNDFYSGLSDEDLCIKYNITKYVCKDYRKIKRLLRDSQGRCKYNEDN